jgi:RuvB-like protein 1 (pontin 52)
VSTLSHRTNPPALLPALLSALLFVQVEGIEIDEESLAYLGEIGERTSLRHAVQLLTPSAMLAKTNGRDAISRGDLEESDGLFHDAKSSARLLHEQADKYIT